jgi:hypothetical protein
MTVRIVYKRFTNKLINYGIHSLLTSACSATTLSFHSRSISPRSQLAEMYLPFG